MMRGYQSIIFTEFNSSNLLSYIKFEILFKLCENMPKGVMKSTVCCKCIMPCMDIPSTERVWSSP